MRCAPVLCKIFQRVAKRNDQFGRKADGSSEAEAESEDMEMDKTLDKQAWFILESFNSNCATP